MKSAAGLAFVGARAAADAKWLEEVKATWRQQMVDADSETMQQELDKVMAEFPLDPDAVPSSCACEQK